MLIVIQNSSVPILHTCALKRLRMSMYVLLCKNMFIKSRSNLHHVYKFPWHHFPTQPRGKTSTCQLKCILNVLGVSSVEIKVR